MGQNRVFLYGQTRVDKIPRHGLIGIGHKNTRARGPNTSSMFSIRDIAHVYISQEYRLTMKATDRPTLQWQQLKHDSMSASGSL